ncbi:hypothetical protein [Haloterrigena alkaliphila]|uniref:Uncharacterized protein n=1 Tax=Haloterrigena alkaliphila TaxID=2816475 RepID=A0A8A2VKP1_9EURY|nr:hypothetical protein [Haloterrigena alkaliphila]QSX00893.1 hypothetical protein J0X25_08020 [Haloterrigena alkaliphila]
MIRLTDREKAIAACSLAGGLVVGLWAGLWMFPAEALAVPMDVTERYGETVESPAFYPVPSTYFAVTIGAPLAAIWFSYVRTRGDRDDDLEADQEERDGPAPATDGGQLLEATDEDVREAINRGTDR